MTKRKVKWSVKAIGQRILITEWYQTTLDDLAAIHFNRDVNSAVDSLVSMPTIGKKRNNRIFAGCFVKATILNLLIG